MEYTNVKGLVTGVSDIAFGTATSTLEDEAKIHDMLDYYVSIGGPRATIAARSSSRANAATRIWTTR